MCDEPQVSVIIPTYNRASVITRCLRSVLDQTFQSFEVIVVDDASEDFEALFAAVSSFGDSRIRLLRHSTNRFGGAARNTGIQMARGELIAFLDSDDEWHADKLRLQLDAYRALRDQKLIVFCQSEVRTTMCGPGRIWPQRAIADSERLGDYLFLNRGYMPTPSLLLARDFALSIMFDESLARHQDYDFLLRAEAAGAVFHMVPSPLALVHWEDFHATSRGLNPELSLRFLANYREYLSDRAANAFILQQVIFRLLRGGRRCQACRLLFAKVEFRKLFLVDWVSLASLLLFRDERLPKMLAVAKQRLARGPK